MAGTRADALRDSIVQESKRPGPAASAAPALTSIVAARSEQGLAATLGRLDSGSRARVAAGIQRTAGNAALQRALSPSSTSRVVVQRAPSDADPLWSLIDPAEQALHEQRIDQYISAVDRGVPWSDPMLGSLRTQINDYVTRKANAQISILNAKEAAKAAQAAEPFGGMGGGVRPGGGFYGQDVVADTVAGFPGGARPPADPFADTLPDALAETLPARPPGGISPRATTLSARKSWPIRCTGCARRDAAGSPAGRHLAASDDAFRRGAGQYAAGCARRDAAGCAGRHGAGRRRQQDLRRCRRGRGCLRDAGRCSAHRRRRCRRRRGRVSGLRRSQSRVGGEVHRGDDPAGPEHRSGWRDGARGDRRAAGSKSLAALGPAGWVRAGIGGFAGGKWLADNALTPLMGIHEAGTTQTYTGSEADKLLHPDEESSGPGSVTETKSYAGKAADATSIGGPSRTRATMPKPTRSSTPRTTRGTKSPGSGSSRLDEAAPDARRTSSGYPRPAADAPE